MHHTVGMAGGQRVGDLGREQRGGHRAEGAVVAQIAVQVGAVDQVHDEGEQIALDDEVAGTDDVGVGEPQQDGALPQEAHHHVRVVRQLLLEDLDRDRLTGLSCHGGLGARRLPLAGTPDGARGTASQRLLEQVLAAYRPHVMRSLVVVVLLPGPPGLDDQLRAARPTHCSAVVQTFRSVGPLGACGEDALRGRMVARRARPVPDAARGILPGTVPS